MVEASRRRAIEDVASDLFRIHGYAATSVRDIARALSIQGPSLYAHVTSKEDVLWSIVDRAASRFEAAAELAAERAAERRPGDPVEAVAAIVRAHV
ncbi:MAG TPA: helix-turn-helix domain-containing protein, partial [Candidatus Binatus sp.]|nr:helix-turn-helix domain-containing protein [Candidatus Binatus sp.]